jgi:thiamine biosynthesis lipoprotein
MPRADLADSTLADSALSDPIGADPVGGEPAGVFEFDAIGVPWRIDSARPLSAAVRAAVADRVSDFDRTWSRFRHDSLVAEISRRAGDWALPDEGTELFALYRALYALTEGRVSPFVGDALEGLGYGAGLSRAPSGAAPVWEGLAEVVDGALRTTAPTLVDVGAVGKGLLVDLVTQVLAAHGVSDATVDASGDLRVAGERVERVALEHPFDTRRAIGVVEVSGGALCASATNRRVWGDGLHHVIDGRTGRPVDAVVATWALAPTAALADGAATALFFVSPAEVRDALGAIGVRMFSDGRTERHREFPGELFS